MTVEYCMARGFESKDVEYQQAERERAQAARRPSQAVADPEVDRRRTGLELSLARMRGDLAHARAHAHRAMIERAIAALEAELASLPPNR